MNERNTVIAANSMENYVWVVKRGETVQEDRKITL